MKIAVCDDNNNDLTYYTTELKNLAVKHNVQSDIVQYKSAKQLLLDYNVPESYSDIIFLEIYMSDMNGIEAAHGLRNRGYTGEIIFLTASKEHILHAFDVDALYYVIKNITPKDKFESIFLRAVKKTEKRMDNDILFFGADDFCNIPIRSIKYFSMKNRIVTVYYDNETFEFFCPRLDDIEKRFEGRGFIRIHQGYLVAKSQIVKATYSCVTLLDKSKLPVGRKFVSDVKEALYKDDRLFDRVQVNKFF